VGIPLVWGFRVFGGVLIDGIRADGGADPGASHALIVGIGGTAMLLVMAVFWVVAFFRAGGEASYGDVIAGLRTWAAQHGWKVTNDPRLTAEWAARFRFTADDLTRPSVVAHGRVRGREAMILYCDLGDGESGPDPRTIIAVDADANYSVTAVVRPQGSGSHDYGGEIPLESVEFERRWQALGWDAAGSHAVFTPRVIERLLEPMPGDQPEIVWDGPGIRSADAGFIAEPEQVESRLLLLADLAGLTPAYQVTHANDDASLRPYVPPPMFRWTVTAVDGAQMVKALGMLTWGVAVSMVFAPYSTVTKVVAVIVVAGVGLAIYLTGRRLERDAKARRLEKWRAEHAPALGPPPSPPRPSPGP
jgi:hypothetical protein